jgi:hypothetical protein
MSARTPVYQPTITLGNIITVGMLIISMTLAYGRLQAADEANATATAAVQREFDQAMIETRRVRPEVEARVRALEAIGVGTGAEVAGLRRDMSELKEQMRELTTELRKANGGK